MTQVKNMRFKESIESLFRQESSEYSHQILTASSDIGIRRNFGRNGSRFAPQSILAQLKKLQLSKNLQSVEIFISEVASQENEIINYSNAIKSEMANIAYQLKQKIPTIHIGGGHDHAYPMLMACDQLKAKKIHILNIDAHCDTRVDDKMHTGTPFRDYDRDGKTEFILYQYGIHEFANSLSTLTKLKRGKTKMHFLNEIQRESLNFSKQIDFIRDKVDDNDILFLSLDVDALHSSYMEGVSAVNHNGLPLHHIQELMQSFLHLNSSCHKIFGIYEYNPLYDNLSAKGPRSIALLIYDFLSLK